MEESISVDCIIYPFSFNSTILRSDKLFTSKSLYLVYDHKLACLPAGHF